MGDRDPRAVRRSRRGLLLQAVGRSTARRPRVARRTGVATNARASCAPSLTTSIRVRRPLVQPQPKQAARALAILGVAIRHTRSQGATLGQHTQEVLIAYGLSDDDIARMVSQ